MSRSLKWLREQQRQDENYVAEIRKLPGDPINVFVEERRGAAFKAAADELERLLALVAQLDRDMNTTECDHVVGHVYDGEDLGTVAPKVSDIETEFPLACHTQRLDHYYSFCPNCGAPLAEFWKRNKQ
jgi:hypothetical protein